MDDYNFYSFFPKVNLNYSRTEVYLFYSVFLCFILIFPRFLSSKYTRIVPISAAIKSATGPAYIIPSIPIKSGKIIINGRRKIICLVSDKSMPFIGFPIAVKKFDVIGCIKFKKVKNKKILKYDAAN